MWAPTRERVKIILLFSLGYFCYYLCRYNYPVALPFIKEEYATSAMTVGWIATALTGGYALGQFVNGFIIDRVGPRIMFTLGGIGSMLANFAMGGNYLFEMFIVAWLVNGYFQSMGYPSTVRLIANWFKPEERGKPLGSSEFFQSVAAILILPLGGFLAEAISWRMVFIVPGVILGLSTVVFAWMARNNPPDERPERNTQPLLLDIVASYRKAFGDWRLLCADVSYGCCQFIRYAMITWIPAYLFLESGRSIFEAAIIAMTFQIGGTVGSLIVGWLADTPLFHERRWMLIAVGMLVSGLAGAAIGLVSPSYGAAIIAILMVCGAGIEALEVAYFLVPADYLGKSLTATGVGCMNAVGKAMATIQGVLLGWVIDVFGYGSAFGVAGAFGLLAAVLILPQGFRRERESAG